MSLSSWCSSLVNNLVIGTGPIGCLFWLQFSWRTETAVQVTGTHLVIVPEMLFCCCNNKWRWSVLIRLYNITQDCWPTPTYLSDTILVKTTSAEPGNKHHFMMTWREGKHSAVILGWKYVVPVCLLSLVPGRANCNIRSIFDILPWTLWEFISEIF